jgi:hypothetical protein
VVVLEAYAAGSPAVRAAILGAVPPGAPDPLRALVLDAIAGADGPEIVDAFEAGLRIAAAETQEAAMRWLAVAPVAHAADGWRRLQERAPDEIVALLARMPVTMRARALAVLTAVPIAALAPLAIDGHVRTFEILRERHDFAAAPPTLLARGILSGAAPGYLERLAAHLRAASVMPAAVAPLAPRLREHVRARLEAIDAGRLLPDERLRVKESIRLPYLALRHELERLR